MKLRAELIQRLSKKFEPDTMVEMKYNEMDLSFKTDDEGNAILLFIGKRNHKGEIKGERYARTLKTNAEGIFIKDHWEIKGKAT